MTPIHKHDCDNCIFLGSEDGKYDFYVCPSEKHDPNFIIRFGEHGDYASGSVFAYRDYINNKTDSLYYKALIKAFEQGFVELKTYYLGYSEKLNDKEFEEYLNSNYNVNKPKHPIFETESVTSGLNDDEYDQLIENYEKELEKYNDKYFKKHGSCPSSFDFYKKYFFNNEEEMIKMCEKGIKVLAFSKEHAKLLFK